jgi:hypothetical protein
VTARAPPPTLPPFCCCPVAQFKRYCFTVSPRNLKDSENMCVRVLSSPGVGEAHGRLVRLLRRRSHQRRRRLAQRSAVLVPQGGQVVAQAAPQVQARLVAACS